MCLQKLKMIVCPLIDDEIDGGDCLVITDVIDEMFGNESYIPDEFKIKPNYKEICKKCPNHVSTWGDLNND